MAKNETEWVSLRRAADILGVHPATVRSWADKGELSSRRTPGGHRRFNRADLEHYAQSTEEDLQPVEVQVIIQNALGRARMHMGEHDLSQAMWYAALSDNSRDFLRKQGREVLDAIRQYLAGGAQDSDLSKAIHLGQKYATVLSDEGVTLPQATRAFFYFSDFVVDSILTWSELAPPRNSAEWSNLLRQVNTFIHSMLLSILEYYEEE